MNNKTGIIRQSLLDKFGIPSPGTYQGPLHKTYISDIKSAIMARSQVALVAQFGAGKTEIANQVKTSWIPGAQDRPLFVNIVSPDKARLSITSVLEAMLDALKSPKKGRSSQAKATNLITALGKSINTHNREVCLVIDNAHRCREDLFTELRDLREQDYNGIKPLFSVLLIGQTGLEGKLKEREEVGCRTQYFFMTENKGWWSYNDRVQYLKAVYGDAITQQARENIAKKNNVPLLMDVSVADAMERAASSGVKDVIDEEVVPSPLAEQKKALGVSLQDIANEAGISKTSVSNVLGNEGTDKSNPDQEIRTQRALDILRKKKEQQQQSKAV